MGSSKKATEALDLDVLERELATASVTRKSISDDPLAELARIVAQDAPAPQKTDGRPSFDDFLTGPPQPTMGALPRATAAVEPLLATGIETGRHTHEATAPLDPLEALLAQDLGLRSGLDEMPELLKAGDTLSSIPPHTSVDASMPHDRVLLSPGAAAELSDDLPQATSVTDALADVPAEMDLAIATAGALEPLAHDRLQHTEQFEAAMQTDAPVHVTRDQIVAPDLGHDGFSANDGSVQDVSLAPPPVATEPTPPGIDLLAFEQELAVSLRASSPAPITVPALEQAETPAMPSINAQGLELQLPDSGRPPARFDDMVAEFEAAMRDMGPASTPAPPPLLQPIIVPPPPVDLPGFSPAGSGQSMRPMSDADMSFGAGAMAAGAIAAGSLGEMASPGRVKPRRGFLLAGGTILVAILGLGGLFLSGAGNGVRSTDGSSPPPVIAAKPGITKERPANPGGVEVPNQDKEILQSRPQTQQAERVAPREEQPVDLTQAQRQASAAAAPESSVIANGVPVRQIPGIAVVAPVTTTPPPAPVAAPAVPAEPAPRPVASVPITIAGQPPVAPITPPTIVPPVPPAPATPPQVASAPAPAVNPPVTPPVAAAPPAEPRRVRAVPIRPENGEAAPTRAQGQPRVVPPAPRAAEPSPENAPLRILPSESRQAAAAPAVSPVQPGTVPSSRPTQDVVPDAVPTRTSSTGSGFSVQLAAEGSEEAARTRFNRMRSQYGSVLGSEQANIRSAEVNGRSVYRIRVGNMSRESAVDMCERLKASGGSCFVARN